MPEEIDHLGSLDAAGVNLEVELVQGQTSDDGEALPTEGTRIARVCPAAYPGGAGAQPAFVDQDVGSALFSGFIYRRPLDPPPAVDLGLVSLNRAAFRALAAEPIVTQQAPDVSGMVPDPRRSFYESRDAGKRPQVGLVSTAHWASDKSVHELLGLDRRQLGLAACLALPLPRRLPPVGHLTGHPQSPSDFRGRSSLLEPRGGLNSRLFHPSMISRQHHARKRHGQPEMSPSYASLNMLTTLPDSSV